MRKLAIVLFLILLAAPAFAGGLQLFDVWYVNVATGSDSFNGKSASTPFKTITKALSVASPFDFVVVYPGTYSAASGEVFPLVPGSSVKLTGSQGARMTIIDGGNDQSPSPLMDLNGVSEYTTIGGFTFKDARRVGPTTDGIYGGAIVCRNNCMAIIESNIFYSNSVKGREGTAAHPTGGNAGGGAIYADGTSAATIRNNVFDLNRSEGGQGAPSLKAKGGLSRGGAVLVAGASVVVHNTFAHNFSIGGDGSTSPNAQLAGGNGGDGWAGGVYGYNGATVANNLIMHTSAVIGNGGDGNPDGANGVAKEGGLYCSNCTVTHNSLNYNHPPETIVYPNTLTGFANQIESEIFHLSIGSKLRGAGSATYQAAYDFEGLKRPSPPTVGAHEPTVRGDLDGDGKADLFWRKSDTGENAAWLMDGTQLTFSSFVQSIGPEFQMVGLGDFNSDRKSDILFRNPATGENRIMLMNGAATQSVLTATPLVSQLWNVIAVADFNGDGLADILWRHANTGSNVLWAMNGANLLTSHFLGIMSSSWTVGGVADFNTDGFPDVLWRNGGTGENRVWELRGNKIETIVDLPVHATEWIVTGFGERYGAYGLPDILWRNTATGENLIWPYNAGNNSVPPAPIVPLPDLQWSVATTFNFDADLHEDILWRHNTTGDLAVWLTSNATVKTSAYLPVQLADPNWKVAR